MTDDKRAGEVYKRATLLMRREQWRETITLLKHESSVCQTDWRLSWNLGWCYFKLDRLDEARKHLIQAAKLAPKNPTCMWALGSVYLRRNQFKKAEALLAESLTIKESHLTRIALALAYLSQGKISSAEKVHLEGMKLKPKKSEPYESYAAFLSDVGREAESKKMKQKAKKLSNSSIDLLNCELTLLAQTGLLSASRKVEPTF
jgi:Tfp pilus assembly protein PilF